MHDESAGNTSLFMFYEQLKSVVTLYDERQVLPNTLTILLHQTYNLQVQSDSEELLIIKTRESLLDALTEHVKANHEYE